MQTAMRHIIGQVTSTEIMCHHVYHHSVKLDRPYDERGRFISIIIPYNRFQPKMTVNVLVWGQISMTHLSSWIDILVRDEGEHFPSPRTE